MSEEPVIGDEVDRRRIRIGLAILVVVVLGAIVAAFVIENPIGQTLMVAIVIFTVVRAYLFTRRLRSERPGAK